jgi:NADH-quinone oxidoreductase subunit L
MVLSAVVAVAGIAVAWWMYVNATGMAERLAASFGPLYRLSLNKFYFDELNFAILVAPLLLLAKLSAFADLGVIDRIVDGVGRLPRLVSAAPRLLHNGLISSYALVMWTGAIVGALVLLGALS